MLFAGSPLADPTMTSQHLVLVCFVSLVILFSVLLAKRVYWHPLSKFPGPVLPATTSFYQFYMLWKGREGQWYRDLHERYGIYSPLPLISWRQNRGQTDWCAPMNKRSGRQMWAKSFVLQRP